MSRASSPAATRRITCTGRPSPRPGPVAWPRSTQSGGSRRRERPRPTSQRRRPTGNDAAIAARGQCSIVHRSISRTARTRGRTRRPVGRPGRPGRRRRRRHVQGRNVHGHIRVCTQAGTIPRLASRRNRLVSSTIVTLTDSTFDEEIKGSSEPVLVDFWAEWCGPCKMIAPVLEEIAEDSQGKLRVGKLNVDENLDIARRFEVMSIPTLILFKDGEAQHRIVGAKGKGQLLQELQAFL